MTTATINSVPTNATMRKLTKPTTFVCVSDPGRMDLEMYPGDEYMYECINTVTETVHIAYVIEDGERFESVKRVAKSVPVAPVVAPVVHDVPEMVITDNEVNHYIAPVQPVSAANEVIANTINAIDTSVKQIVKKRKKRNHMDDMEGQLLHLANVAEALSGNLWYLTYDIPDCLKQALSDAGMSHSPCSLLHRFAYRLNLSVWVIPQKQLDSPAIQDLLDGWRNITPVVKEVEGLPGIFETIRINTTLIKFAPDQLVEIKRKAADMLQLATIEMHRSLIKNMISADTALEKAQAKLAEREKEGEKVTAKDRTAIQATRDNRARQLLKDAMFDFDVAIKSAEAFDAKEELSTLFAGVRAAIRAQANAYNAYAQMNDKKEIEVTV